MLTNAFIICPISFIHHLALFLNYANRIPMVSAGAQPQQPTALGQACQVQKRLSNSLVGYCAKRGPVYKLARRENFVNNRVLPA